MTLMDPGPNGFEGHSDVLKSNISKTVCLRDMTAISLEH